MVLVGSIMCMVLVGSTTSSSTVWIAWRGDLVTLTAASCWPNREVQLEGWSNSHCSSTGVFSWRLSVSKWAYTYFFCVNFSHTHTHAHMCTKSSGVSSLKLTSEQLRIVNHRLQPGDIVKVVAFAGQYVVCVLYVYKQKHYPCIHTQLHCMHVNLWINRYCVCLCVNTRLHVCVPI